MTSRDSELHARLGDVQQALATKGFGGLVAYYGAQHNMLRPDPIMLLTDHRSLGPSALFVPAFGAPTLVVTPRFDQERARGSVGCKDVIAVCEDELVQEMVRAAKALPGPLAMIGTEVMPLGRAADFFRRLGHEPADGGDIVRATALVRKPFELERVAKAAEIADKGFARLCEVARPGMREFELAAEVEAAMQELGSEDNFGLIATGSHNVAVRAVNDRVLEPGDVVIGEITPCYRGYFAQLCRTFILGEPTELQRRKFDMLHRGGRRRPCRDVRRVALERHRQGGERGHHEARIRRLLPPAIHAHARAWSGPRRRLAPGPDGFISAHPAARHDVRRPSEPICA